MNLISKGIEWFNQQREEKLVESVALVTSSENRIVKATVLEPETMTSSQGVRVKTDTYIFLVEKSCLHDLDIRRGFRIMRDGVLYEAVQDNMSVTEYNDPNNTTISIHAKIRQDSVT